MEKLGVALLSASVLLGLLDVALDATGAGGRLLSWSWAALAVVGLALYVWGRRAKADRLGRPSQERD